ncbi:MAG: tRNA (guanosine(46)-N7)-methyltransferase TrmB [Planctomycetales bacterium]
MARRALPKLDPQVDFSDNFRIGEDLTPGDPNRWFERAAPLVVEVGSGKGRFLLRSGEEHPDVNFLGIELAPRYAQFIAYRAARKNLRNVRAVHGDALRLFRDVLPDESIKEVHVYFPDPWWKKRHHKRRVMTPAFVADVSRVLKSDGRLHFRTDVRQYHEGSLEILAQALRLQGPIDVPEVEDAERDCRTHRELRCHAAGEPIYRAEFVKQ